MALKCLAACHLNPWHSRIQEYLTAREKGQWYELCTVRRQVQASDQSRLRQVADPTLSNLTMTSGPATPASPRSYNGQRVTTGTTMSRPAPAAQTGEEVIWQPRSKRRHGH